MKTPKKAIVTKKLSEETLLNSKRWIAFCNGCQQEWDDLSPQWKDFFFLMGEVSCTTQSLNEGIDKAREDGE